MSLIKFRAGKVSYDVSSKTATALPVQGQITIKPSQEDDSFFSFEWSPKDNVVNIEKDEFLIIPGDASWTHIEGCKTGRVFALEFVSSGARHLFWMQEVNDNDDDSSELSKKDQEITQKIKSLLEIPEEEEEEEEEMEEVQQAEQSPLA
jgi:26S proteasome regulatory subunit N13